MMLLLLMMMNEDNDDDEKCAKVKFCKSGLVFLVWTEESG